MTSRRLKPGNWGLGCREIFGEFTFVHKEQLRVGLSWQSCAMDIPEVQERSKPLM